MQIKRGRPKKVIDTSTADSFFEEVDGTAPTKPVVKPVVHTEGSLGTNRIYRRKDGTTCLVTYSGNKKKPEEIHFK